MDSSTPRRRVGSHRSRRSVTAAVLPSLLAVLAVASLITALAVWRGEDPTSPSAAASTGSASPASREALSRAPASSTGSPAASQSTPSTTTSSSAPDPVEATPADDAADFSVEVVVLNQTSTAGLAGRVADVLRGKGWAVPAVGNFHGVVPATTVYYPPGDEAAAQAVAEDLPVPPRLKPRFGNLSTSRLTVVVTDSYPR